MRGPAPRPQPISPRCSWSQSCSELRLGSRAPIAEACADCGVADGGLEPASWRFHGLGPLEAHF
eukprot:1376219-Alexandrium_andersonii.AAC.1